MAPGLELEYRNNVRRIDQRLVLGPFVRMEGAFVRPLGERIDPFLYWWINSKGNEASRGLRVEAAAQGVQKTIQPGRSNHARKLARWRTLGYRVSVSVWKIDSAA